MLQIRKIVTGPLKNNCYLAIDEKTRKAVVIDPAIGAAEKVAFAIGELNASVEYIINTHGHWDHVADNAEVRRETHAKLLVHALDAQMLESPSSGPYAPRDLESSKPDGTLSDGREIRFGESSLRVIHTPGHTPGGICLYSEKDAVAFTGDTLFANAVGRTNLPGSDSQQMLESLRILFALPPRTKVLPGHGRETTIGEEKNRPEHEAIKNLSTSN